MFWVGLFSGDERGDLRPTEPSDTVTKTVICNFRCRQSSLSYNDGEDDGDESWFYLKEVPDEET